MNRFSRLLVLAAVAAAFLTLGTVGAAADEGWVEVAATADDLREIPTAERASVVCMSNRYVVRCSVVREGEVLATWDRPVPPPFQPDPGPGR